MKKFYLAVVLSFCASLLFVNTTYAQYTPAETFETIPAGGNLSDPTIWINGNIPSGLNPCDHCKVILHGVINVDLHVILQNTSLVVITSGTTVNMNDWVLLFQNSQVDMYSNTSLFVNDELDLVSGSFITMINNTAFIDANNAVGHAPNGLLGSSIGAGIYYLTDQVNYPNPGTYQIPLIGFGYGDPAFAPGVNYPGTPGVDRFFTQYEINCFDFPAGPPFCAPGVINGPATSGLDPVYNIFSFTTGTALPVTLVQLTASRNDDGTVSVLWATSQEQNASYFDVERSGDAGNWEKVGTVKAKGFSSIATNYSFKDLYPLSDNSYYRLKMVDLDGKFKYSKVVSISSDIKGESLVIFNNPYTDMIRLRLTMNAPDNLTLTVTDILGKRYANQSYQAKSGDNFININPGGAAGVYILHIQGRGYDKIVKLVKQ